MPRSTEPMLGDDLLDAYRAFVFEIYDALSAAGFPDLPQAATPIFRDIEGQGSLIADLAARAGYSVVMMRAILEELEGRGYVAIDGDLVVPAARGREAFVAGRQVLADAERRWEQRLGAERMAAFRDVLRDLSSYGSPT